MSHSERTATAEQLAESYRILWRRVLAAEIRTHAQATGQSETDAAADAIAIANELITSRESVRRIAGYSILYGITQLAHESEANRGKAAP